MIKFITGNKTKYLEAKKIVPNLGRIHLNLPEIQEIDFKAVVKSKLKEAFKHHKGPFLVEDSGLSLEALNWQLPGPLIKWFNITIGGMGIYQIAKGLKKFKAEAVTMLAFATSPKKIEFFIGKIRGKVVSPRGGYKFGYDEIFVPNGSIQTLSEMKAAGDFSSSPRGLAFRAFKEYLKGLKHNY